MTIDMGLTKARYLTPMRFKGQQIFGAAYNEAFQLCSDSQRYSSKRTYYQHGDPAVITQEDLVGPKCEELLGHILYLGHSFSLYGHFLLETLPMIDYVMNDAFTGYKFLFLPFGGNQRLLLDTLKLLEIDSHESKIVVYNGLATLMGSFLIAPRPIEINHRLVNVNPYKSVIAELKKCPAVRAYRDKIRGNDYSKVFLHIGAKRTTREYADMVENVFQARGFRIISPEKHTLAEQIALMSEAKYIAGFSGSALHNAIFAEAGAKVIELGDSRFPLSSILNQKIVAEIAAITELEFIPYQEKDLKATAASLTQRITFEVKS